MLIHVCMLGTTHTLPTRWQRRGDYSLRTKRKRSRLRDKSKEGTGPRQWKKKETSSVKIASASTGSLPTEIAAPRPRKSEKPGRYFTEQGGGYGRWRQSTF